jgi:ribosomal protein S18 acetylase RimI-like enzyme
MENKNIKIRKMQLNKYDILKYKEIRLNFLKHDWEDSYYTHEETKKWDIIKFLNYFRNNFHSNLEYDFLTIVEDINTNKFIGMWWVRNMWYNKKHVLYIQNIYLEKKYRWLWIGRKLFDFIIQNMNTEWIKKIKLDVLSSNKIATNIYEKEWFDTIWTMKKDIYYNGKYYNNIIMEKYL